jgi:uncharacterized protein (DUF1501 family)
VIGTGVKGGQFFGQFPSLSLGGPDDACNTGTSSVDQYGATLAQWFGVPAGNMPTTFSNSGNFLTANLGILG